MLSRETWSNISLSAIRSNYESAKGAIHDCDILPVLKANAYGHGLNEVGRFFDALDAPFLSVASLDEAYQLIEAGVEKDILIFSYLDPVFVMNNNRSQLIFSIPSLEWYQEVKGQGRFHLEINSGMNRMGVKDLDDAKEIMDLSKGDIEGIYTHFSSLIYDQQSKDQAQYFTEIYESLEYDFDYVHAGNISIKLFNELKVFNSMRMGLGLFGYREDLELTPAMELFSNVIYLTEVDSNDTVGYSYDYDVREKGRVASIPIGYADGFDKRQENLLVYINDNPFPIVGGICMDLSTILVDSSVEIGDKVELLGTRRTMKMITDSYRTSPYEVLTRFGSRITRNYKK